MNATAGLPEPTHDPHEALKRLADFCRAVHTLYSVDENPEPEGLIVDSATDWATPTGALGLSHDTHHLLLADLETIVQALDTGGGPDWMPGTWQEWANDLAALIPEEDVGLHANPDAAQESIICDVLKGYADGIHAVLQLHRPSEDHPADKDPYCIGCWEAGGMDGAPSWPCPTVQALGVLG